MTTTNSASSAASNSLGFSAYVPLACLALTHTLVDTCALLIDPLWPTLERVYAFGMVGLSLAFIVQSLPTSISQAVFGFLRDRRPSAKWLWLGPSMAAIFLTSIGMIENRAVLFALMIVGGIGVGAFHPEAAVMAGRMLPGERTRGISVFMFGGSLGLALGPIISGLMVSNGGLQSLIYLAAPILILIWTLRKVGRLAEYSEDNTRVSSPEKQQAENAPPTISEMFEGKGRLACVLLLTCSLRLVPNMAMNKVLAFTLKQPAWGFDEMQIGIAQSVFLIAASVGMFAMMFWFRAGWEKRFLVVCPLLSIPFIMVLSWVECPPWLFFTSIGCAGIILWGTSPAMVSYAQQQFPKGSGLASALTMGLAWGIGGLIQAPITSYFNSIGEPQMAYMACVPFVATAGIIAIFMPNQAEKATTSDESGS
jgi:FSR family fosmidomycin resistance protein-like MFS transporter